MNPLVQSVGILRDRFTRDEGRSGLGPCLAASNGRANNDATLQYPERIARPGDLQAPTDIRSRINANLGVFAQDQWAVKRMTVNPGMRFDYFDGWCHRKTSRPGLPPGALSRSDRATFRIGRTSVRASGCRTTCSGMARPR